MRRSGLLVLLLCLPATALAVSGGTAINLQPGGTYSRGENSVVRLARFDPTHQDQADNCSAVIIGYDATAHRALFLTAAHCIYDQAIQVKRKGFARHDPKLLHLQWKVGSGAVHNVPPEDVEFADAFPRFLRTASAQGEDVFLSGMDLALLRVRNITLPAPLQPIPLLYIPQGISSTLIGRNLNLIGYARSQHNAATPLSDFITAPVRDQCTKRYPCVHDNQAFSNMLLSETTKPAGLQEGDSGGAQTLTVGGRAYLVGINSVVIDDPTKPKLQFHGGILYGRYFGRFVDWIQANSGGVTVTVNSYTGTGASLWNPSSWIWGQPVVGTAYVPNHTQVQDPPQKATLAVALLGNTATSTNAHVTAIVAEIPTYITAKTTSPATALSRQAMLRSLDVMEHHVYQRFNAPMTADERKDLLQFLDVVASEHFEVMRAIVAHHEHIYLADNPGPVPAAQAQTDFQAIVTALSTGMRDELLALEGQPLVAHQRLRVIANHMLGPNTLQIPGFRDEVLAQIARIMSRPEGRRLVHEMLTSNHRTWIWPYYNVSISGLGAGQGAKAVPTSMNSANPGVGCGGYVLVEPDIQESDYADLDAANHPILSPAFLGLAHELIHVRHYYAGAHVSAAPPAPQWTDMEEFNTIQGPTPLPGGSITENVLRNEHHLAVRGSHQPGAWQ